MVRIPSMSYVRLVGVAASAAVLCIACFLLARGSAAAPTENSEVTLPTIDIMASDYAFDSPDTLPAGLVAVRLMNHGREPHHAQLLRLDDGLSFEDFVAALDAEGDGALRLATLTGGPGALSTLRTSEVTLDLTPGSYVLPASSPVRTMCRIWPRAC